MIADEDLRKALCVTERTTQRWREEGMPYRRSTITGDIIYPEAGIRSWIGKNKIKYLPILIGFLMSLDEQKTDIEKWLAKNKPYVAKIGESGEKPMKKWRFVPEQKPRKPKKK